MLNGSRLSEKAVYITTPAKTEKQSSLIIISKNTAAAFIQGKVYIIFKNCNI